VVEQESTIQGIKMFKGVKLVFITKQKIVTLSRIEPIVVEGVHVVIKVKCNEPKFNQHNGNIIRGIQGIGVEEFIV